MRRPITALPIVALLAGTIAGGCIFGGGGDNISAERPGSIPTATPPATLPEPILVGEVQPPTNTGSATAGTSTYVVKSGDTLNAIAAQVNIAPAQQAAWVAEVLRLNGIPDASLLQAGVELRLPAVPATPRPTGTVTAAASPVRTPTTAAAAATPTTAAAGATATRSPTVVVSGGGGTYTVVSGDYPVLIAEKLGVPEAQRLVWAQQMLTLNGLTASGLQVGQVLQLPPIPSGGATPTP
jgi:LysM repeat protein